MNSWKKCTDGTDPKTEVMELSLYLYVSML